MQSKFQLVEKNIFDTKLSDLQLNEVNLVGPETSLQDVVKIITNEKMSSIIIENPEGGVGVITEIDFLHKVLGQDIDLKQSPVKDYMSKSNIFLGLGNSIRDCILLIAQHEFRHIVVVDKQNKPANILSAKDVINFVINAFPEDISQYNFAENWKVNEVQEVESFYETEERDEADGDMTSAALFFKAIRRVPSNPILKVDANEKIIDVVKKLQNQKKSTCVIMDKSVDLLGVVTDRDFVRKVLFKDIKMNENTIDSIMIEKTNTLLSRHFFVNAVNVLAHTDYRTTIIVNEDKFPMAYVTQLDMIKYIAQELFGSREGMTVEPIFE